MILSPAKQQDFSAPHLSVKVTIPRFLSEAEVVAQKLKSLSEHEIEKLMKVSSTIAASSNASFEVWGDSSRSSCALFAYRGEVFRCFHETPLTPGEFEKATDSIRVLSAVYGMLKPTDLIEPYRLEVKTKIELGGSKNLYHYWKELVTTALLSELAKGELLLNIASVEYARMIDWKKIPNPVITPCFKVSKEGEIKRAAVWAKKARGYFARFLLQHDSPDIAYIKSFNKKGFSFSSFDENSGEMLFLKEL